MYYRRRKKKKVNKNELKQRRGLQERRLTDPANTLRRYFPNVEHLTIELSYRNAEGFVLDEESRAFAQDDTIDLSASCPGRCGTGRMDLAGKIRDMVSNGQQRADSRALCREPIAAGTSEGCGCELMCRLQIAYREPDGVPAEAE